MTRQFIVSLLMLLTVSVQGINAQNKTVRRCAATTQQGIQCKNKVSGKTKYCNVHKPKATAKKQCKGKTQDGKRCQRKIKNGNYCSQHKK